MSFRMGPETTMKFVTIYLENECLWNTKSPLYKNKENKKAAYVEIGNEMNIHGFGEKEIKMKIKNIRSTYSQELKKIKESQNSGASKDTLYVPSLNWFALLDGSLRNGRYISKSESHMSFVRQNDEDIKERNGAVETVPEFVEYTPRPKKQKTLPLSNIVGQLKEISQAARVTSEENEFEVFGQHVGLQLKSLPLLLALDAQQHIQLYINKVRRQHIQNSFHNDLKTDSQSVSPSYESEDNCCTFAE